MKLEEYLTTVTEQIRCQKARELVSDELRDHVLDQAKAYEAEGMFEEEALEKAVQEMGDPVATGVSLDRVHRPQMSVEILAAIGIISIFSLFFHGALRFYNQAMNDPSNGYLQGYFGKHLIYTIYGYILMLLVYRLDYSILARYGKLIAGGFLGVLIISIKIFGVTIHGTTYMKIGSNFISIPMVLYLYVPLFGNILYQYRGEGYKTLVKLFIWAAIPTLIALHIPSLISAVVLCTSFAILVSIAVWQNWYQVNKKVVISILWAIVLLMAPVQTLIWGYLLDGRIGIAAYQIARLRAFISHDEELNYQANIAAKCLSNSQLLGNTKENIAALGELPALNSDYAFVSFVSVYGILAGILVVALFVFLLMKIFRISFRQRNQLGMILGCSCGTVFLLQLVLCLGVNLGLLPTTATTLPFFSSGSTGIVTSYILLGLVLSVYRYKNILTEKQIKKVEKVPLHIS